MAEQLITPEILKRIEIIENTDLKDISISVLPQPAVLDYFFISYSHYDYKKVYKDIFYLQSYGLNIWYDLAMPAGKSWKDIAVKNMTPFSCKGVLFYISENSLLSDAVVDEIEFAIKTNKSFIPITLPFENDYIYEGENVKGKVFSIRKMIDILSLNNKEISQDKIDRLNKLFPDEVLYLDYYLEISRRVEQIKQNIKEKPLLFGTYYSEDRHLMIESINDISTIKISEKDFYDLIKELKIDLNLFKEDPLHISFSASCFANCRYLEYVELPKDLKYDLQHIGEHAFYNNTSFKGFLNIDYLECYEIGDRAFYNCTSLEEISINNRVMGNEIFTSCTSLRKVNLGFVVNRIGINTFLNCPSIEEINTAHNRYFSSIDGVLFDKDKKAIMFLPPNRKGKYIVPETVAEYDDYAFQTNTLLEEIVFGPKFYSLGEYLFEEWPNLERVVINASTLRIGHRTFEKCPKLKEVKMKEGVVAAIAPGAFYHCDALTDIYFPKTRDAWNNEIIECYHIKENQLKIHCVDTDFYYDPRKKY